jgi:hypothetical protein
VCSVAAGNRSVKATFPFSLFLLFIMEENIDTIRERILEEVAAEDLAEGGAAGAGDAREGEGEGGGGGGDPGGAVGLRGEGDGDDDGDGVGDGDGDSDDEAGAGAGAGAGAAGAGAQAGQKRKRRAPRRPLESWWDEFCAKQWVRREPADKLVFLKDKVIFCTWCACTCDGSARLQNILSHETTRGHKDKGSKFQGQPGIAAAMLQQAARAPSSAEKIKTLRGVLALSTMGSSSKSGVVELYSDPNLALASFIKAKAGSALGHPGAHSVIDDAYNTGYELMMGTISQLCKDQYMSVLLDEGSTSFAGRSRPLAITLCLTGMKPMCLDLIWDYRRSYELPDDEDDEGWHSLLLAGRGPPEGGAAAAAAAGAGAAPAPLELPNVRMAKHVKARLQFVGINLETQVTGVVSDSANLMTAIARELGLPRLECLSHMLHDVAEAAAKPFKLYHLMTVGLNSVLTAGGGVNRDNALQAAGVCKSRCKCTRTRWGQVYTMANYLTAFEVDPSQPGKVPAGWTAPFESVRKVMRADVSFQLGKKKKGAGGAGAAAEEEDGEGADDVMVRVDASGRRKLKDVLSDVKKLAFEVDVDEKDRLFYAPLEAAILSTMVPNINALITKASANPDQMDFGFPEAMQVLKGELTAASRAGRQGVLLEKAYPLFYKDFEDEEKEAALEKYAPLIKAGADAALKVFTERVEPALARLEHRWRFDPRRQPVEVPIAGEQLKASDLERFFGVAKGQFNLGLEEEWERYRIKWPGMSPRLKSLGIGQFWGDAEVRGWFPSGASSQLVRLGRWYATLPTSNVASERVFGVVRGLEDDQRRRANEETVSIETLARCNSWVVDLVRQNHGRLG